MALDLTTAEADVDKDIPNPDNVDIDEDIPSPDDIATTPPPDEPGSLDSLHTPYADSVTTPRP